MLLMPSYVLHIRLKKNKRKFSHNFFVCCYFLLIPRFFITLFWALYMLFHINNDAIGIKFHTICSSSWLCVYVCFVNRIMEYQRKYKCYYFLLSGKAKRCGRMSFFLNISTLLHGGGEHESKGKIAKEKKVSKEKKKTF